MKRIHLLVVVTLVLEVSSWLLGSRLLNAHDGLKSGTVLKRTELKGAPGSEAILVQREVPPGAESGSRPRIRAPRPPSR